MKSEEGALESNPTFREPSFKSVPVAATPVRCAPGRYRECLKNHAASAGGKVLDGCGEFMPGGEEGTFQALQCAACSCHRNFHRKETGGAPSSLVSPPPLLQLPPTLKAHVPVASHWMAFGSRGGGGSESSSEDLNFNTAGAPPLPPYVLSKKRFRTKFTQDQKTKMLEYAEKVGWRIPREDDAEIQRFCAEVGVKRQVFKVWMHNNKSNTKKQIQQDP